MKAYIDRIQKVNPYLNAIIQNRFKDAIIEAKICDEQFEAGKFDAEILEKEKPLFGIPFTVKECCAVKGTKSMTCCRKSSFLETSFCECTGVCVEQLYMYINLYNKTIHC